MDTFEEDGITVGPRIVALGDTTYDVIDFDRRTVLMDHYFMRKLGQSGADKLQPEKNETGENAFLFLARVQSTIINSGVAHELIAGYLLPKGIRYANWTPEVAKRVAAAIGALQTQEDREAVYGLCTEIAFGFFKQGLEQLARSLVSLQGSPIQAMPESQSVIPLTKVNGAE